MAYEKQTWQPRTGSGLNRFIDQDGNILVLTAAPTEIINPGTPFTADRMSHIEDGIAAVDGAVADVAPIFVLSSSVLTRIGQPTRPMTLTTTIIAPPFLLKG